MNKWQLNPVLKRDFRKYTIYLIDLENIKLKYKENIKKIENRVRKYKASYLFGSPGSQGDHERLNRI